MSVPLHVDATETIGGLRALIATAYEAGRDGHDQLSDGFDAAANRIGSHVGQLIVERAIADAFVESLPKCECGLVATRVGAFGPNLCGECHPSGTRLYYADFVETWCELKRQRDKRRFSLTVRLADAVPQEAP